VTARPLRSTLRRESASHSSGRRPVPAAKTTRGSTTARPADLPSFRSAPGVSWKAGDTIAIGGGRGGGTRRPRRRRQAARVSPYAIGLPSVAGWDRTAR
jgi:hypothetical protein